MKKYTLKIDGVVTESNGQTYEKVGVSDYYSDGSYRPHMWYWGDALEWFLCGEKDYVLDKIRKNGSAVIVRNVINEYKQNASVL